MTRTLHLVALPHTELTDDYLTCAYSQKVRRAVGMFRAQGERVILYGPDVIDCEPNEHVVISTEKDRKRWGFGDGFDTARTPFEWDLSKPYWTQSNALAAAAVRENSDQRDLLLVTTSVQWPIAQANPALTVAEWSVGYEGIYLRRNWFSAFESHAWRHWVYGLHAGRGVEGDWRAGRAFDTVIPSFVDPGHFHIGERGGYLLFVGRVIERKGPHIAAMIARHLEMPLVVAGPGGIVGDDGVLCTCDTGTSIEGEVEYVGSVGPKERADLMSHADALLMPTIYIEPGGNVALEAMMSGTPVVASDWGCMTETVENGVTGHKFSTLQEGIDAILLSRDLNAQAIRDRAVELFSLDAVGAMYSEWFNRLDSLWEKGWPQVRDPVYASSA